ncbi:MAG: right-handed parallel beta-helix repeat-containing protein [Candidatus Hodarchaeota archaeon]
MRWKRFFSIEIFLIMFFLLILLFSQILDNSTPIFFSNTPEIQQSHDQLKFPHNHPPSLSMTYKPHDSIFIDSNTDFNNTATAENWPGNGTPGNPYIIEGLNITIPFNYQIIAIRDTNVHFKLKNNFLVGDQARLYGISLINIENGEVSGNIISNTGEIGIDIVSSSKCIIKSNQIRNCTRGIGVSNSVNLYIGNNNISNVNWEAIHLEETTNSNVSHNILFNNGEGISITTEIENTIFPFSLQANISVIGNTILSNHGDGIHLRELQGNTISDNRISNNEGEGIYLWNSGNNTILNNSLRNDGFTIEGEWELRHYSQAAISNNTVNGKALIYWQHIENATVPEGIGQVVLVNCTNVTVSNQNLSTVSTGLFAVFSPNLSFLNSIVANNTRNGIQLFDSSNSLITNFNLYNNSWSGIHIESSWNSTISENNITYNKRRGINIRESGNTRIVNNNVSNNLGDGINLETSERSTISDNFIFNNSRLGWWSRGTGVVLWGSGDSNLSDNRIIANTREGIAIWDSPSCIMSRNFISRNRIDAIVLDGSGHSTILDNILENQGLTIDGWETEHYKQVKVENNTVNGKPLIYWQNYYDKTVPKGAGQIILVDCMNIEVMDQDISNASTGILAVFSYNLLIQNNRFSYNNRNGIFLKDCTTTEILNNDFRNNKWTGITLEDSENSIISENIVSSNNGAGIELFNSGDNTLSENTISNNQGCGIYMTESSDTKITKNSIIMNDGCGIVIDYSAHITISRNTISYNREYGISLYFETENITVMMNDFIGNYHKGNSQASDDGRNNQFYRNYWSDWIQPDRNGDGVVDNPYLIDGESGNYDNHPRVSSITDPIFYIGENTIVGGILLVVMLSALGVALKLQKSTNK